MFLEVRKSPKTTRSNARVGFLSKLKIKQKVVAKAKQRKKTTRKEAVLEKAVAGN